MKTVLWEVKTTFCGADGPSKFYFDTRSAAEMNLMHLSNGDITKVSIESDYPLNYFSGCTYNDLTYGNLDAEVKEA